MPISRRTAQLQKINNKRSHKEAFGASGASASASANVDLNASEPEADRLDNMSMIDDWGFQEK
jgi:hypothetical protein